MKLLSCHIHVTIQKKYVIIKTSLSYFYILILVIAGGLLAANIERPALLSRIENGFNNLFHEPADAFYTGRVMDILFNGVTIDCTVNEPFTSAICSHLEGQSLSIGKIDENHLKFSIFGNVSLCI